MNKSLVYTTGELRARVWPRKIDLRPPSSPLTKVIFLLTVPRLCFCCGLLYFTLLFLSLYIFALCMYGLVKFLIWIAIWPIFGKRNCPFDFLLVMFSLWCRCFKCVLLSLWCLGRNALGINCIDSRSLPYFLLKGSLERMKFSSEC